MPAEPRAAPGGQGSPGGRRVRRARSLAAGERRGLFGLLAPGTLWVILFFLLPLLFVAVSSFMTRGPGGQPVQPWTLDQYERTFTTFAPVLWRSLNIAFVATLFCLILGYPVAFFISRRRNPGVRMMLLFLVLLPFWTNFLVRTYALITIMQRDGLLNGLFQSLGILQEPLQLLFTPGAVMVGLVYGYLPFMILPIYASVEALDHRFVEAAHDLGANDFLTFMRVVFPLTLPGVIAGCILVFIPTIGAYVTPDLMGGTRGLMIGNLIQSQFGGRGNIPLGSAVSMVLLALVFISVFIYSRWGQRDDT